MILPEWYDGPAKILLRKRDFWTSVYYIIFLSL